MLKRFLHYYKPHKRMMVLDMLAALLISLIGMLAGNAVMTAIALTLTTTALPASRSLL